MRKVIAVAVAALAPTVAALTGCASDEAADAVPTTAAAALSTVGAAVELIYPGVPEGTADDLADDVCAFLAEPGHTLDEVSAFIVRTFSGGSRPDPTPEQVAAILAVIEPSCPQ
jgi:hypothetical protein